LYDAGVPGAGEAANMAKYAAAEAGIHCVDRAIQAHGGNGFALEYTDNVRTASPVQLTVSNDSLAEEMKKDGVGSDPVPRKVGAAAEAVLESRGETQKLKAAFERSSVPMVMVDGRRRYVEVNRPARLWFRLGLDEMRTFAIGDLTPAPRDGVMEQTWARLLDVGSVAGRYPVYGSDGSLLDVVYCGLAHILPGLHLIAFAPADWSEDELEAIEDDGADPCASLTPRETEVLALAADGLSGPELAQELVLSLTTVQTHFKNIYAKLNVRNRAAAVAKAMRLGAIE
jgi:DNA-binding CsgD family transcriptional regulator